MAGQSLDVQERIVTSPRNPAQPHRGSADRSGGVVMTPVVGVVDWPLSAC